MVAIVLLSGITSFELNSINHLSVLQKSLSSENQQLLSWGIGDNEVASFLQNVTQIGVSNYTISLSNTLKWRPDLGGVAEEIIQSSLQSSLSNLNINLEFMSDHFSLYQLNMIQSSPIFAEPQPNSVLNNAKTILARYKAFSGDAYLTNMTNLINTISTLNDTEVTQGYMKLDITVFGDTVTFLWMYSYAGIDYQAKGLQMTFQNNVLTSMSDGYYLFTIGSTNVAVSQDQAVNIAKNYVKTLTWTIEGQKVSGFDVVDPPLSVQFVPHPRGDSVALVPYWYIEMSLTNTYPGGINEVTVGIYADTGQVSDVQMLSGSAGT